MLREKWGYQIIKQEQSTTLFLAIRSIFNDLLIIIPIYISNIDSALQLLKNQIREPIRIIFKLDQASPPIVCFFEPQHYKYQQQFLKINTYLIEQIQNGFELIISSSYYQSKEYLYATLPSSSSLDETGKGLFRTDQKCQICDEYFKNCVQLPCCTYQNHLECFKKYLNLFECYTFNGYICQNQQCKRQVDMMSIQKYMDANKFQYIKTHYLPGYMKCSGCSKYCFIGDAQSVKCDECNTVLQYTLTAKQKLMLNDLSNENLLVIICPFCNEITTKDDNCNHVTCVCKKDLCSLCSADRIPILAHGAHYHRIGCKHYHEYQEEYDPVNCMNCKVNMKKCQKPEKLVDYISSKKGEK